MLCVPKSWNVSGSLVDTEETSRVEQIFQQVQALCKAQQLRETSRIVCGFLEERPAKAATLNAQVDLLEVIP